MIALPKHIKPRLFCSFSGGKTSAYMAYWIKHNLESIFEVRYVFANTGQEHEKTLEFVNACDKAWGLGVVWIEAVVNQGKKGTSHKIASFDSATRDGSLFVDMVKKYGLPNNSYPHCTRELKISPMTSYIKSLGWKKGSYVTAIGIRADEMDRVDPGFEEKLYWYPLITLNMTKRSINKWWQDQSFALDLPEHLGNCTWCWKKTIRKHLTLAKHHPEVFEVPRILEQYKDAGAGKGDRKMFRKHMTVDDIFELSKKPFEEFDPSIEQAQSELDLSFGCSESCEVFTEASA